MIPTRIKWQGESVAPLSVRNHRRVMKETHFSGGRFWWRRYMRLHFLPSAHFRYGYQQRAQSTREKKLRLARRGYVAKGGRADLVFFGNLERAMLRYPVIRAFPTRATVNLVGPRYLHIRSRSGRPDMASEILSVTDGEHAAIVEEMETTYAREVARTPDRVNTTIK